MEIILVRHGKPVIPSLNIMCPSVFAEWVESYNASGLSHASTPTEEVIFIVSKCKAIVCSELLRSIDSARALKVEPITLKSSIFNEAGLPIANWDLPKLSPRVWAVIFRILWFFGYSRNSESYKEAKIRASVAANILQKLAEKHTRVLFVGHGVFNRMIANELNASGWPGPKMPGTKHWSYSVYKYKKHNNMHN